MSAAPLFDLIDKRVSLDRGDSDAAYFFALTSKFEYLMKVVTAGVLACLGDDVDRHRYSIEHKLVRADSIGGWVEALSHLLIGPPAEFFDPKARELLKDLTERVGRGDWRNSAVRSLSEAASAVGSEPRLGEKTALRQCFEIGVQLRNRSRGHGAPTTEQCSRSCPELADALHTIADRARLFTLPWAFLHCNLSGKYRVSPLLGDTSCFDYLKRTAGEHLPDGVYLYLDRPVRISLIFSDPDLQDIFLPNGNFRNGQFETLSYVTNSTKSVDSTPWAAPPGQLPPSETEGDPVLGPLGKTFANVPPLLNDYIPRPDLVDGVRQELLACDRHPIVSLTGPGGIGKTTIAIAALRDIADHEDRPYEVLLWISARDTDLLEYGAKPVRRNVISQDDIAHAAAELLEPAERTSKDFDATRYFEKSLKEGTAGNTLFVLDNFETVQNPADVFAWIDTHVRPPNKVLITTRIRDFQGDYAIPIGGMNEEQARALVDQHAHRLGIDGLLTPEYKKALISESDGHPYVMRIMLGQVATERQRVKPERIMANSDQVLRALFERTYNALSPSGQKVFLLLCSWRVLVPEVAVVAVSLRPGNDRFDVNGALDELYRFSLIYRANADENDHLVVGVPLAVAIYGRMKLASSPLKVSVEEDRKLLMEFGPGRAKDVHQRILPRIVNLYRSVAKQAQTNPSILEERRPVLEFLANSIPRALLELANLMLEVDGSSQSQELAKDYVKRFLEGPVSHHDRHDAWLKLADLCRASQDWEGEIHAVCEAALVFPSDMVGLGESANRLNNRLRQLKAEGVEDAWSTGIRELLGQFIQAMERRLPELNATNCSRLAWLHLNVNNEERARDVAKKGLARDPENEYCSNLIRKLDS